MDQGTMAQDQSLDGLTKGDAAVTNPWSLFQNWMAEARQSELNDPNAMALATADADGIPNVRMVLLKDADEAGFVFYTNVESSKGRELTANPKAALLFHWKSLRGRSAFAGR
jgi:pyridoxamine 5'-phosphate oxidase